MRILKYKGGKKIGFDENRLKSYVSHEDKKFRDENGNLVWETHPKAKEAIDELWVEGGYAGNAGTNEPWSAVTTSNLAIVGTGNTKDTIENFRPSEGHHKYIFDAFKSAEDPNYKYNLYKARPLTTKSSDGRDLYKPLKIGDMLFSGRESDSGNTTGWSFDDFRNKSQGDESVGYSSHADMITDKGQDDKGYYYVITGGNRGAGGSKNREKLGLTDEDDSGGMFKSTKLYYDPRTGELKNSYYQNSYKGVLELNKGDKEESKEDIIRNKERISSPTGSRKSIEDRSKILYNRR